MAAPREICQICLISIFLVLCAYTVTGDEDFESMATLILEHSLDGGSTPTFEKRGTITISSIKSGVAHHSQTSSLSPQDKDRLKDLAESEGIYRIRVPSKPNSVSNGGAQYVSTFVPACSLYESRLSDMLTVNVDSQGNVLGVSLTTLNPACHGLQVPVEALSHFNTTVEVVQTTLGPAPETQTYVQKMEQEKKAKEKGQEGDNRSFFAKYWMYLVPLVIFLMFAGQGDQGGGGGGRS